MSPRVIVRVASGKVTKTLPARVLIVRSNVGTGSFVAFKSVASPPVVAEASVVAGAAAGAAASSLGGSACSFEAAAPVLAMTNIR
eukprot:CAMPEP_0206615958 /NCGR_PEP_ID=MMETSP0325_2-20121206/58651_1 /ASSEMBLY_ACC=CAM_ASM_000347 /TAXON_ID=2866 /ORGANISM="Crypthecodinium cohnii, Strain Seligo" /LENGTH=84 /DNA_ID=CAMNT_0054137453 /DNA_START=217 /DNA_END=471 /DNA_ORIENTATION=-